MSKDSKTKDVKVAKMITPQALTLTKKPANQVAFRVVRADDGSKTSVPVVRVRRRRSISDSAFLSLSFSDTVTVEEATEVAESYGLTGYEVTETDKGVVVRRSDYTEPENGTFDVNIGSGRVVTIARNAPAETIPDSNLKLVAIEFDKEIYRTDEEVVAFLDEKSIDFIATANENTDTHCIVKRFEVTEGDTVGKVEIAEGVVAHVVRADDEDVPAAIYSVVSEAAYGNWGWGQLDFAAMLLDRDFCKLAEEANSILYRVTEDILFYSGLPIAARKELLYRAASQYALYVGNLLDGLPPGVVLVTRSILETKEKDMTKKQAEEKVEREDTGDTTATETPEVVAEVKEEKQDFISRADAQQMITEAVAAALAAVAPKAEVKEEVQRSDDKTDKTEGTLQEILRSVKDTADKVSGVSDRVAAIESSTIVRSDSLDSDRSEGKPSDPFSGVFAKSMK